MDHYTKEELVAALQSIASMTRRSEKAQRKFAPGTSQHTLQKNRMNALSIASSLIKQELAGSGESSEYTKEGLEAALAPIASLISKSEKARRKLAPGTWQHTMLEDNLKALHIALPIVTKALGSAQR